MVPAVTSLEMPEAGKKPGSSRPGLGAERGAGRAGTPAAGGGPRSELLRGSQDRGSVLLASFSILTFPFSSF